MFKKILICNRGEIALRVMRTCKEMGIECVAVHAAADRDSLHVKYADESVCVGKTSSAESYLKVPNLIAAAEITGAEAIHPGYGFLAENADFAETVIESGFTWIGPAPETIRSMGDKATARGMAEKAGVPTVPGTGLLDSVDEALEAALRIGYPVLLKATAGGGGKGMRPASDPVELRHAYSTARAEAKAAFGNDNMYMEKYLARQVDYRSAGTVEFLLDEDGSYYFMEMNTRIQVEHPVTEFVTGVDLIREQLLVAAGEPLDFRQEDVKVTGCAIECRVNAEDPMRGFLPQPGTVRDYHAPGGLGVRVDSHIYTGYAVPPYYDSLLAKIIVHGRDRTEAIARMVRALEESVFEGVPTSIPFHIAVMNHPVFRSGQVTTRFYEDHGAQLLEAMHVRAQEQEA